MVDNNTNNFQIQDLRMNENDFEYTSITQQRYFTASL